MGDFVGNRYRIMRSILQAGNLAEQVVLDLGSGGRPISSGLTSRLLIRADIRPAIRPTLVCDLTEPVPLGTHTVDLVIAGEIIEHIVASRKFLAEIHRVLVPGGRLLLSTPNVVSLKYRVAFLLGRIPAHAARADYTYAKGDPAFGWGHVRDYSFGEVRAVLEDNGFRVTAEHGIGLTWRDRTFVPAGLLPRTLSDQIIVQAEAC